MGKEAVPRSILDTYPAAKIYATTLGPALSESRSLTALVVGGALGSVLYSQKDHLQNITRKLDEATLAKVAGSLKRLAALYRTHLFQAFPGVSFPSQMLVSGKRLQGGCYLYGTEEKFDANMLGRKTMRSGDTLKPRMFSIISRNESLEESLSGWEGEIPDSLLIFVPNRRRWRRYFNSDSLTVTEESEAWKTYRTNIKGKDVTLFAVNPGKVSKILSQKIRNSQ